MPGLFSFKDDFIILQNHVIQCLMHSIVLLSIFFLILSCVCLFPGISFLLFSLLIFLTMQYMIELSLRIKKKSRSLMWQKRCTALDHFFFVHFIVQSVHIILKLIFCYTSSKCPAKTFSFLVYFKVVSASVFYHEINASYVVFIQL